MAEFIPGFNILDPASPFLGGNQTIIPMQPGYVPPAPSALPTLPQWAQQAPTISPAAKAAAGAPGAATDPTAALLSKILANNKGIDPRAAQIMAYYQLQQANPGTGPITGAVNPIVNALMARRLAPQIQQQQQTELLKQQLEALKAVAGIAGTQAKTKLTTAQTNELEQKAKDFDKLTPEQQQSSIEVAYKVKADPNAELKASSAADAIIAADTRARLGRDLTRSEGELNRQAKATEGRLTREQKKALAEYHAQNVLDLQDNAFEQQNKIVDLQEAGKNLRGQRLTENRNELAKAKERFDATQKVLDRTLRADIANANLALGEGRLNFDQNREDRIQGANLINNAFRYSSTLGKGEQREFLTDLAPVLKKYNPSIDFSKTDTGNWYYLWLNSNPELQITPTTGTQQPIPQGTETGSTSSLTPPVSRQFPRVQVPTLPTTPPAGGGITGPDTTVASRTPQENALATPTGRSYPNVPADLQPASAPVSAPEPTVTLGPSAGAAPQLGPVQVDPSTLGVNPNFLYPAQVPYINPPDGTAPALQDQFNNLFQASDAYMGQQ